MTEVLTMKMSKQYSLQQDLERLQLKKVPFFLHLTQMFTKDILIVLSTLHISIPALDYNNLQSSYVLRILFVLCFWREGDWLGMRERGTKPFISFFLGGGGIEYFPMDFGERQILW